ncbi:extracellular solute-binding protein [Kribbella catacumbae]|uniref:extracellular solute-binding protein n=1 Tax=Kribbella catacumbae TaxID=460086 RepID=UPI00037DEAA5|nr:extracellular solute-binding protein [Kribbella catacumbae]
MASMDRPFSRRRLLAGAAALAGGGTLLGCAPSASRSADELSYWHLMSGGDGIVMAGLVDAVNASNAGSGAGFKATQTVLAWGPPYYTKLAMASAGGRAPDVAVMHASRIAGYAPGGLLEPWDLDLLAEVGIHERDFPPLVWQKGQYDGKLYSIALDTHPFVLYYNTSHADKAGVTDALHSMNSPEGFTEVATKLQKVTGKHGLSYGYLGDGSQMWRLFYTLYRQQGAEMKLVPGQQAQVDEAAAVKALTFVRSLLNDTIATRSGDGGTATSEFLHGESGMFFGGVWELPVLKASKLPFDAMPIPALFGTQAAYADSHTFVLPRQSEVSAERRRHTYQLVAEILKRSVSWAGAGHIPAYQPVIKSSEYQALKPQSNYAGIPAYVNYDPDAWFGGAGSDFHRYFAENVQNVYLGSGDPAAGFDGFVKRLNVLLDRPQPV